MSPRHHNPVKEWLARVAAECGTPLDMEAAGLLVKNENSRRLIINYAQLWARRRAESKRA